MTDTDTLSPQIARQIRRQAATENAHRWLPEMPVEFRQSYQLANYDRPRIEAVMRKYLNRIKNNKRAWKRICFHMPETLTGNTPLDILEFSTAHGAMLDIWRHFGQRVVGTDYAGGVGQAGPKPDEPIWFDQVLEAAHDHPTDDVVDGWVYQPIIESLGLDVRLFDAGQTPYAFDDKSFDILCCYQALEAYAHPDDWERVLDEFCRITRKSVVIGFNPPTVKDYKDEAHRAAFAAACERLRCYDSNGFKAVYFELGQTFRGIHPMTCKLVRQD